MKTRVPPCTAALLLLAALPLLAAPAFADPGAGTRTDQLPPGNLDCSGVIDVTCGQSVMGNTTGGLNSVSTYPCTPFDESGPERVYRLVLAQTTNLVVTLTPLLANDLDLFLLGDCNENFCIAVSSTFPQPEVIVNCLTAGTYYIVVDGFEGEAGPFQLDIQCTDCTGAEPANDLCSTATDLGCGTIDLLTNTVGAGPQYTPTTAGCTGEDQATGPDVVYRVEIPPGGSVNLQFSEDSYDGSIYLVTDCFDIDGTCLSGSDCFPFPCTNTIAYTNITGSTINAFLVVDGFASSSQGLGTLTGTVDCPPVPTENATWGRLKSVYR